METTDPFADDFYFLQVTNCGANCFICWYFYGGFIGFLFSWWIVPVCLIFLSCLCVMCGAGQLSIKKNAQAREAALKEQSELPQSIYVPLPVWKETKERILQQMNDSRRAFHDKSRSWEVKEQVLGHQVRTNIHRPREQLSMPSMSEMDMEFNLDDDNGTRLVYVLFVA
jgi:hypothetical protein